MKDGLHPRSLGLSHDAQRALGVLLVMNRVVEPTGRTPRGIPLLQAYLTDDIRLWAVGGLDHLPIVTNGIQNRMPLVNFGEDKNHILTVYVLRQFRISSQID